MHRLNEGSRLINYNANNSLDLIVKEICRDEKTGLFHVLVRIQHSFSNLGAYFDKFLTNERPIKDISMLDGTFLGIWVGVYISNHYRYNRHNVLLYYRKKNPVTIKPAIFDEDNKFVNYIRAKDRLKK